MAVRRSNPESGLEPTLDIAAKVVGLSLSNEMFFSKRIAHCAKEKGLRIVWSSEMIWHHKGEIESVRDGLIDKVLYTSEVD
jgi:hypothetical protein